MRKIQIEVLFSTQVDMDNYTAETATSYYEVLEDGRREQVLLELTEIEKLPVDRIDPERVCLKCHRELKTGQENIPAQVFIAEGMVFRGFETTPKV